MVEPHPAVVVARLPLLGPLMGWTRSGGPGVMLTRLWAGLDNRESETPLAMMTVSWDRSVRRPLPGTARLWRVTALCPGQTDDNPWLYFGLADVSLPAHGKDVVVRVVALHRCIRAAAAGCGTAVPPAGADEHGGAAQGEGWRRSIAHGRALLQAIDSPETYDRRRAPDSVVFVRLGEPWPQPTVIDVDAGRGAAAPPRPAPTWLDEFAGQALEALSVPGDAGAPAARPVALPSLRKLRAARPVEDCEVAPGPAVQASMRQPAAAGQAAPAARTTLRFAAGCCRYPGTPFERDRADRALQRLADLAGCGDGPAFAIFSGDQVYADATAGVFEVQGRLEKIASRYEDAFATDAFRRLVARLPIYMTADDHEIEDGWSLPRAQAPNLSPVEILRNDRLLEWASQLFLAYQRMHGPPPGNDAGNWFDFAVSGVSFFMMDTRFERGYGVGANSRPLCRPAQMKALIEWLQNVPASAPKVIVSGSVFAPGLHEWADVPAQRCRGDTWQGFAAERAELCRAVAARGADNLVFLSGDYHCAAVSAIRWMNPGDHRPLPLRAWSIVTPPLYAPFPFANSRADDVMSHESIDDPMIAGSSLARCTTLACNCAGFALITVEHGGDAAPAVTVEILDPCAGGRKPERLDLSGRPWDWSAWEDWP